MLQEKINNLLNSDRISVTKNNKIVTLPHPAEVLNSLQEVGEIKKMELASPQQNALQDNTISTAYNNYLLIIEPENTISIPDPHLGNQTFNLGVLVSSKSNLVKVFSGIEAHACTNQFVWAENIEVSRNIDLNWINVKIQELYNKREDQLKEFVEFRRKAIEKTYSSVEIGERLGNLALAFNKANVFNYYRHLIENFDNANKVYYDMPLSDWKLYNLATDLANYNRNIASKTNQLAKVTEIFA